jgi:uncharacterized protein
MKFLILVGLIGVVMWWLKTQRNHNADSTGDAKASPQQQNMVRCAHCDLHLPQIDAVSGSQGVYCSVAHRAAKEG